MSLKDEIIELRRKLSGMNLRLNTVRTDAAGLTPGASPTFVGLTLSGLTASVPVVTNGSKALASVSYATFKASLAIAQADVSGLTTGSSPTFVGLNLSGNIAHTWATWQTETRFSALWYWGIYFTEPTRRLEIKHQSNDSGGDIYLTPSVAPSVGYVYSASLRLPKTGTAYRLPAYSASNVMTELAAAGADGQYLRGNTGAIPSWATLNQAAVDGLKTSNSPTFVGLDLTGLTDGRVLYVGVGGLANSPIYTDGTNVGIGTITPGAKLGVAGNFSNFTPSAGSIVTGDSSTFTAGIGTWTYWYGGTGGSFTAVGGKGVFDTTCGYYYWAGMAAGTTYTLSIKIRIASGPATTLSLGSGASGAITGISGVENTFTISFKATGASLALMPIAGTSYEVDDISLTGPTVAKWIFPGQTTGVYQSPLGNLISENGLIVGTTTDYATSLHSVLIAGAGNKTYGLLRLVSTSGGANRGTFLNVGYTYLNSDSAGLFYWWWGARYDGETAAWVRAYTAANNWLPYLSWGTSGEIIFGSAETNDKTDLVPIPAERVRFDMAAGNIGLGQSTFGTSAAKVFAIGTGTAPTTSPADAFQMYSADQAAGNACAHFRTEGGAIVKLYQQAHIADAKADYAAGDLDTEAEIITAVNAANGKINSILAALENNGLLAAA